ncbi:MAG: archaellin/type IV pilin N-terminal domain-containing protein [Candidatus Nanohaloarchaea archaeon]|nr:archaellin/type IV pilin N-terminal domain-containing protein [Candidatus Nanohaloarchaea archaeon]
MNREGITPVVAVVLLLMMTVAAAGAFYAFTQGIIGGRQEQARQQLNTELQIKGLSCTESGDDVDFFLVNSGDATVDASDVTLYLYNVSTGELSDTTSASAGDIAPGGNWDSTADFGANLVGGLEYRVEFEFTNQGSYTVSGTCQAS